MLWICSERARPGMGALQAAELRVSFSGGEPLVPWLIKREDTADLSGHDVGLGVAVDRGDDRSVGLVPQMHAGVVTEVVGDEGQAHYSALGSRAAGGRAAPARGRGVERVPASA